jgi:competence ComEA-like helix-hairpin-helix protein
MALYSRHQLLVLVAVLALFGSGLAIDRWRRAHPAAVERVELFDRGDSRGEGTAGAPPRPAPATPFPLDLNRATADELGRLPGIGPGLAARIVETRDRAPFASVDDLRRVRGVGAAKLERLRPLVSVGAP